MTGRQTLFPTASGSDPFSSSATEGTALDDRGLACNPT